MEKINVFYVCFPHINSLFHHIQALLKRIIICCYWPIITCQIRGPLVLVCLLLSLLGPIILRSREKD